MRIAFRLVACIWKSGQSYESGLTIALRTSIIARHGGLRNDYCMCFVAIPDAVSFRNLNFLVLYGKNKDIKGH